MQNCVSFYSQLSSIMDILTKAAVAEIIKLVDDSCVLRLEMSHCQNENERLKRKLLMVETELRAARRSGAPGSCSATRYEKLYGTITVSGPGPDSRAVSPTEYIPCDEQSDTRLQVTGGQEKRQRETVPVGGMEVFPDQTSSRLSCECHGDLHYVVKPECEDIQKSLEINEDKPGTVVIKQERLEDEFDNSEAQRRGLVIITAGDPEEQVVDPSPAGDCEELEEPEDGKSQTIQNFSGAKSNHNTITSFCLDSGAHDLYERDAHLWTSPIQRDSETETDYPEFPASAQQDVSDEMESHQIPITVDGPSRVDVLKKEEGMMHVETGDGAKLVLTQSRQMEHRGRLPSVMTGTLLTEDLLSQPCQRVQRSPSAVPGSKDKSGHTFTGSHINMTKKKKKNKNLWGSLKGETQTACVQCMHCEKTFKSQCYLTIHQRIHTGERPFPCTQCDKTFYCASHLISHRRCHTGERPYRCEECGNTFSHPNSLKAHHASHRRRRQMGEKPFRCVECGAGFMRNSRLKNHMAIHSGAKALICSQCGYCYRDSRNFTLHQKAHVCRGSFC